MTPPEHHNSPSASKRTDQPAAHSAKSLGATIHFGIFAFLLAVTVPRLLRPFAPTGDLLDTSWAWMMGHALRHHLQWGKTILFTYGPLGFLTHPYFYSDHTLWALSATARLTLWFILGLGFAWILRRLAPDDRPFPRVSLAAAFAWILGAHFLHLSAQSAFLGVLLLVLAIAEQDVSSIVVELTLCGALLAFGALIKSTALIVSLFALLVYPALWRYARGDKKVLHLSFVPLLSFVISLCALWLISSQSISNVPAYFRGTWAIASGYTPAMSIYGPWFQLLTALIILALFTAILFAFFVGGKKIRLAQSLILGGLAFWAWKEGFTLHDPGYLRHPMTFYGIALLIAGVGTVLLSKAGPRKLSICAYAAYAVALWSCFQGYPVWSLSFPNVFHRYQGYLALVFSKSLRSAEQDSQTMAIKAQIHLSERALNAVGHASVNVIPWSLMMAQGYRMHLVASPVIQSYSAYTPYLDKLNARQIWEGKSADKIIYTFRSIEHRYPIFDEPATFRALLTCYRTEAPGKRYSVLSRVACAPSRMHPVGKLREGTAGMWLAVPAQARYARIRVRATMMGHLMNLLYKASHVRIVFRLADGSVTRAYRFIYPVAADGLFIRYFVNSQPEADSLFSGHIAGLQRISAIKILTSPGSTDYARHYRVRFFGQDAPHPDLLGSGRHGDSVRQQT